MTTFFFDYCIGVKIPQRLRELCPGAGIECFDEQFPYATAEARHDDHWLPIVGAKGWFVVSKDRHYHRRAPERAAVMQYGVGCFCLGGGQKRGDELLALFLEKLEAMLQLAESTPRPFIYIVPFGSAIRAIPLVSSGTQEAGAAEGQSGQQQQD